MIDDNLRTWMATWDAWRSNFKRSTATIRVSKKQEPAYIEQSRKGNNNSFIISV